VASTDPLTALFAQAVASLTDISTQLATIATNLTNNPNIPAADVTAAQGIVAQLGTVDTTLQQLAAQTGNASQAAKPAAPQNLATGH